MGGSAASSPRSTPPAAVDEHDVGVRVDYPTAITTGRRDRIYVTSRFGAVFRIDPAHGWPRPGAGEAATGGSANAAR